MPAIAYEDLVPGQVIDLGTTTIDRDEMVDFARRFDPQPFHIDEEAGKDSILGGLCASGWYTASLWMRAYVDHLLADSTSQGSPGGRDLTWTAPVYPGDTLRFLLTVNDRRRSTSKPGLGLIEVTGTANRENGTVSASEMVAEAPASAGDKGNSEQVMTFTFLAMFTTRE